VFGLLRKSALNVSGDGDGAVQESGEDGDFDELHLSLK